ncbi:MAG: ThuA domain-containing protein [Caldilineaceae bacterium]
MAGKSTALALIGDRYHNSDYIRTALGKTLVRELGLTIDFTDEVTLLNADTLQGYKLLILFRDAMQWPNGYDAVQPASVVSVPPLPAMERVVVEWMTPAQGQAVKEFVLQGGSALLYHNVTYIAAANPVFREVLGAATEGHPPVRPFKVQITNPDHPITRGVSDFVVTDEQHYLVYDQEPAHVLMRSVNEEGLTYKELGATCEAGWAYEYGQGRVCYLSPGHTIPALWNPAYVQIQQNAVRWLLHQI